MSELPVNQIIYGEALEVMQGWPDECINCCISSPPYWALRDYGVDGQLGLEKTFEEYIDKLCTIYDEVKRILRPDGTVFVNLGDTYVGGPARNEGFNKRWHGKQYLGQKQAETDRERPARPAGQLPTKSLCLIPQRFAIEMVNRGWILRNVLIWHKPNPMPSSAKDRFTVDFEQVFFFVKSKKYWFEPQYEAMNYPERVYSPDVSSQKFAHIDNRLAKGLHDGRSQYGNPALGRNKRCVWTIPTQSFPDAHFATYPEKLVEPMIRAGCPEFICTKCGKPREKVYEQIVHKIRKPEKGLCATVLGGNDGKNSLRQGFREMSKMAKGYTDCGCGKEFRPGVVLDCFCGIGDDFAGGRKAA